MSKKRTQRRDAEKLVALTEHLMPGNRGLPAEVRLSVEYPARYVKRFADRLEERGIDEPLPALPWIALVDGLMARRRLVEIDWRELPEVILEEVQPLVAEHFGRSRADKWARAIEDEEGDWMEAETEKFLFEIGRRLAEQGLVLAVLDIKSDSYPLIVLKQADFPDAKKLAAEAGYGKIVRLASKG